MASASFPTGPVQRKGSHRKLTGEHDEPMLLQNNLPYRRSSVVRSRRVGVGANSAAFSPPRARPPRKSVRKSEVYERAGIEAHTQ